MCGNFCVPLVINELFSTLLNFDIFNRACKHNCTTTLAEAAIASSDSAGINVTRNRKLHCSTMTTSVISVFFHLEDFPKTMLHQLKAIDLTFFSQVISRAPGLKLVVQTLLSSIRPIGNIVLICCTFFIIFGILGVQVNGVMTSPIPLILYIDSLFRF